MRSTARSRTTTAATPSSASAVQLPTGLLHRRGVRGGVDHPDAVDHLAGSLVADLPALDRAHGLQREHRAHLDDDEEEHLVERQVAGRDRDAGGALGLNDQRPEAMA